MTFEITKHKNILIKILKNIYTDQTIGPVLGFKGGTAAYLFYGLNRFSVDLDFDLLDESKEDYVFEKIEKIIKEFGVIKEKYKKQHTLFFILTYTEETPNIPNIKVEISRRNFGSGYELKNYLGISMLVMIKEDMFAHKLVAMHERLGRTNRDIFDVWFFLQKDWLINKEIVEKRTGMHLKEFLQKSIDALEKMSNTGILAGIGDLLDTKQKVWAKANLKKDVLFLLKVKLESLK